VSFTAYSEDAAVPRSKFVPCGETDLLKKEKGLRRFNSRQLRCGAARRGFEPQLHSGATNTDWRSPLPPRSRALLLRLGLVGAKRGEAELGIG